MIKEYWVNVYFGVYGNGEPHYSAKYASWEDAAKAPTLVGYLAYRLHVCCK